MRLSQFVPKNSENHMKTRALGYLLMVAAAGVYAVGCGSSNNNNGTGGAAGAGTGGRGGAAGAGQGGAGTGGVGTGGRVDSGTDTAKADTGTDTAKADTGTDTPVGDAPADTQTAPTFSDVYAIISNATVAGCTTCHDGINPADGGAGTGLPHGMNFATKAAAYAALVGVDSIRCGGSDAGVDASAALKRVLASNATQSVLVQKLLQGMGTTAGVCDTAAPGMPINLSKPNDGGATDGGDAGFTTTTYAVSASQLTTIEAWINAGAQNN